MIPVASSETINERQYSTGIRDTLSDFLYFVFQHFFFTEIHNIKTQYPNIYIYLLRKIITANITNNYLEGKSQSSVFNISDGGDRHVVV